ncbi:MAG: GAF domain-containing protein [Bacteroidales bacterium]|nr:GAF domain-containing protein [Bacteroidales bacterium]
MQNEQLIQDKQKKYETLLQQLKSLLQDETNKIAILSETCAIIHDVMGFFWVGFYLVEGDELVLGPFQGSVACLRIKKGRGVCGTAWQQRKTIIVPDVEKFAGHIACSTLSRSEIVVPIFNVSNGTETDYRPEILGVLDIDSTEISTFDEIDAKYLEEIIDTITRL